MRRYVTHRYDNFDTIRKSHVRKIKNPLEHFIHDKKVKVFYYLDSESPGRCVTHRFVPYFNQTDRGFGTEEKTERKVLDK